MGSVIFSISLDSKYDRDLIDKFDSIKRGKRSKYIRAGMKAFTEWKNYRTAAMTIHTHYEKMFRQYMESVHPDIEIEPISFDHFIREAEVDTTFEMKILEGE